MSEEKIRISVVSYLNSTPFVWGLENSKDNILFDLSKDIPSVCATKLLTDQVDIGLIPVAMIPKLIESYILSNYCIGAFGEVASVLIIANQPLETLETIILDSESRTSIMLAKILVKYYWKLSVKWVEEKGYDFNALPEKTGAVIIGDRALKYKNDYNYNYDLADAWKSYSGLPFVFACWVSNKKITPHIEETLNNIFKEGLFQRENIVLFLKNQYPKVDIREYLFKNIQYELTLDAKKGMVYFLELIEKFNSE